LPSKAARKSSQPKGGEHMKKLMEWAVRLMYWGLSGWIGYTFIQ
jgi:hypothetical protein